MIEVACCLCGRSLHTDTGYVELTAVWKPPEQRDQMYYAHTGCMDDLTDPDDFGGFDGGDDGAMPMFGE
jgi:hypothetical protein